MMEFIMMTISFTVAILAASVISTVVLFKLMRNAKFATWFTNYYITMIQKFTENFEKELSKDLDA